MPIADCGYQIEDNERGSDHGAWLASLQQRFQSILGQKKSTSCRGETDKRDIEPHVARVPPIGAMWID